MSVPAAASAAPLTVMVLLNHSFVARCHSLSPAMFRISGKGGLRPRHDENRRAEGDEQPENDAKREVGTPDFQDVRIRHALRTSSNWAPQSCGPA